MAKLKKIIVDIKDFHQVLKEKNLETGELIKILEFAYADKDDLVSVKIDTMKELVDKYRYKPE